jgi:hypothetical protein
LPAAGHGADPNAHDHRHEEPREEVVEAQQRLRRAREPTVVTRMA